eukprot:scaffold4031_cov135-Cylindrotheca_fusiformis.AAC.12
MPPLLDKKDHHHSTHSASHKGRALMMRNEVDSLRNTICELQLRLENVEQERNYNAAKANELQDLVKAQTKGSAEEALVQKSLQVAEMSMTIDKLNARIQALVEENHKVRTDRHNDTKQMEKMSGLVRSLQHQGDRGDNPAADDAGGVLTPEKALDMTIKNLNVQMEALEEDRQELAVKCKEQETKIDMLENDNKLLEVKVDMLEELFRSLNQERNGSSPPPQPKETAAVPVRGFARNNSLPDLFSRARQSCSITRSPETTAVVVPRVSAVGVPQTSAVAVPPTSAVVPPSKVVPKRVPMKTGDTPEQKPQVSAALAMMNATASVPTKAAANNRNVPDRRSAFRKSNSSPDFSAPTRNRSFSKRMTVRERRAAIRGEKPQDITIGSSSSSSSTPGGNKGNDRIVRVGNRDGSYMGPMKNGLPNGMGTIRFSNGDTYLGQVVDGKMHGKGTFYHSSRELGIVRGSWCNNERVEK